MRKYTNVYMAIYVNVNNKHYVNDYLACLSVYGTKINSLIQSMLWWLFVVDYIFGFKRQSMLIETSWFELTYSRVLCL